MTRARALARAAVNGSGGAVEQQIISAARRIEQAHQELAEARRELRLALEARAALPGYKLGLCGTPAGYRRHQRNLEPSCWACLEARRLGDPRRGRLS